MEYSDLFFVCHSQAFDNQNFIFDVWINSYTILQIPKAIIQLRSKTWVLGVETQAFHFKLFGDEGTTFPIHLFRIWQ